MRVDKEREVHMMDLNELKAECSVYLAIGLGATFHTGRRILGDGVELGKVDG